jgi:hypothetical protein
MITLKLWAIDTMASIIEFFVKLFN